MIPDPIERREAAQLLRHLAIEAVESSGHIIMARKNQGDDDRPPVLLDGSGRGVRGMDPRRYLRSVLFTMQHLADQLDPFWLTVEDVFVIKDRGTCVTGKVAGGLLRNGDELVLEPNTDPTAPVLEVKCLGIETFGGRKRPGDRIGVLLGDVDPAGIEIGSVLSRRHP